MIVLGVESSCDETAASLVTDDGAILSDVVASQVATHAPFGGVVPELASRAHLANLGAVLRGALEPVGGDLARVDAIAVTNGPGLVGALLVGVQAAKALAFARGLPLIAVDHLVGHLFAVYLRRPGGDARAPDLPFIALLASGGHTALYEVRGVDAIERLGSTRDDAAGEAFDKVAKLLGLGYPGGPLVDRLAALGDPRAISLPMPLAARDSLEFSFSGLKTAVAQHVRAAPPRSDAAVADVCASFQRVVVETLARKALRACEARRVPRLALVGGVAANRGLRARTTELAEAAGVELFVPPLASCTDNAAMIAYVGAKRFALGHVASRDLGVYSVSPL